MVGPHTDSTKVHRGVLVTGDERITLVIDEMTDYERSNLAGASADQGTCFFEWEQPPVPVRFETGASIIVVGPDGPEDSWVIGESVVSPLPTAPDELSALPYSEYLLTPHWRRCRERAFAHYGRVCVLCPTSSGLQVHHRNYKRLGRETLEDLIVLCGRCHAKFHRKAA